METVGTEILQMSEVEEMVVVVGVVRGWGACPTLRRWCLVRWLGFFFSNKNST